MAETDECAHRACFLIAEVTVIHSVVIKATGSTAIDILESLVAGVCVCGRCSYTIIRAGMAPVVCLDGPVLDRVLAAASLCRDPMTPLCFSVSSVMLA